METEDERNEGEEGSSDQNLDQRERTCDFCSKVIKSLIPHVKGNKDCEDYYCAKFIPDDKSKTQTEKLKHLGSKVNRIRKTEAQKRKREDADYVKELNRRQRNQRQTHKKDPKKCYKDFSDKVFQILSGTCQGCNCYVSPQHLVKVEFKKSEESEGLYLCQLCQRIAKDIENISEFAGDSDYSKEYNDWAVSHFTVEKKIKEMKTMFNSEALQISMTVYNTEERNVVIFPEPDSKDSVIQIVDRDENLPDNEPTVLLPQELLETKHNINVSMDEAALASQSYGKNLMSQLSIVMSDRLDVIETKKKVRENSNLNMKRGKVDGNTFFGKDKTSLDNCLSNVKGTIDYLNAQKSDIVARQKQNGLKNIKFLWPVLNGLDDVLKDPMFASCLLRLNGHKVKVAEIDDNDISPSRDYRVACSENCVPFECELDNHEKPTEKLKKMEYNICPFAVARFLNEKCEAFVEKIVRPIAKDYYMFLSFDRPKGVGGDSGFFLAGNIWVDEITDSVIPEALRPENVRKLLGDGWGQIGITDEMSPWGLLCYGHEPDVTEVTRAEIECTNIEKCRETSLIEFIMCTVRSMKVMWASQRIKFVSTEDPRKVNLK